jgi:hypothetical protein
VTVIATRKVGHVTRPDSAVEDSRPKLDHQTPSRLFRGSRYLRCAQNAYILATFRVLHFLGVATLDLHQEPEPAFLRFAWNCIDCTIDVLAPV